MAQSGTIRATLAMHVNRDTVLPVVTQHGIVQRCFYAKDKGVEPFVLDRAFYEEEIASARRHQAAFDAAEKLEADLRENPKLEVDKPELRVKLKRLRDEQGTEMDRLPRFTPVDSNRDMPAVRSRKVERAMMNDVTPDYDHWWTQEGEVNLIELNRTIGWVDKEMVSREELEKICRAAKPEIPFKRDAMERARDAFARK